MIPDYDIKLYRKISGICTQIDIIPEILGTTFATYGTVEKVHEFLMSELISIVATQTVAGQVSEAEVVFDNDPTKKFQAGDVLMIWLGWQGQQIVTMDISGYIDCIPSDIGKQVRDDGAEIGTLISYENSSRSWKVSTQSQILPSSVMTITSGTGSGTSHTWTSGNLQKVFSGIVYEASSQSNDEEKTITLRAKDWSFLLLTGKFTASYPSAYRADLIIHDMFSQNKLLVSSGDSPNCAYSLSDAIIEATISTRQLDFAGEPLIDSMIKVSEATEHDWYIDEEKRIRWFLRRDISGHRQYRDDPLYYPSTPLILYREDLTDYNVTDPEELLCNKVKVYGRDNKVIPWNYDAWTESIGNPISDPFYWTPQSGGLAITAVGAPPTPKKGTHMIKVPAQKVSGNWWSWDDDGWSHCHTVIFGGPGSAEWVLFKAYPGTGKKIRLNSAGGHHTGDGHLEIWYGFGESPGPADWTQLGYDNLGNIKTTIYREDAVLYVGPLTTDYVENSTPDSPLQIKWKLTGFYVPPPFFSFTGCFDLARVLYGDETTTGSEVFTARLKIPSPIAIFSDGGTSFWTLVDGIGEDDSEEVKKGLNSYKVTLSAEILDFYHNYDTNQNYTTKSNIGFWFYGQNTGSTIDLEFSGLTHVPPTPMATGYRYTITDNFEGWKWFEPERGDFITIGGFVGWDIIRSIRFHGSGDVSATYRLDWLVNSDPLDATVDLETKASAKKLIFVAAPNYGTYPSGISSFIITFGFIGEGSITTNAQFFGIQSNNWTTIEIPVGEDADGWSGDCIGTLDYIEFKLTSSFSGVPADGDFLLIDWVHFDEARWYGENEDATSELNNGVRFKELFDDTLYSDTAAARRAVEYIKKFKDPIITIKDVEADYIGMENLDPGKVLVVDNSVPEFANMSLDNRSYRIETIEHHIEENDYYVKLILSLDPIYFEGNVQQISERVRRIEQKERRKPAANPTEVE